MEKLILMLKTYAVSPAIDRFCNIATAPAPPLSADYQLLPNTHPRAKYMHVQIPYTSSMTQIPRL